MLKYALSSISLEEKNIMNETEFLKKENERLRESLQKQEELLKKQNEEYQLMLKELGEIKKAYRQILLHAKQLTNRYEEELQGLIPPEKRGD